MLLLSFAISTNFNFHERGWFPDCPQSIRLNPYAAGGLFGQYEMIQKKIYKNYWNPATWVLIWQ